ncbi:hypothetical protein [Aestuariivirga sp.]|uniref:hypothetical protein n=1 Tax=Aestuariivirga sp. TaxID=2650926 RepID=UPI0039E474AF
MRQDARAEYWLSHWHLRDAYGNPRYTGSFECHWLRFPALGGVSILCGMKRLTH